MIEIEVGINANDLKNIIEVFKKNQKINEVILFGSRAKGTFAEGSDIDIALKGSDIELNDILDLSIEIDKLDLPYIVDLIIFDRISEKSLLEHIARVGKSLYKKLSNH